MSWQLFRLKREVVFIMKSRGNLSKLITFFVLCGFLILAVKQGNIIESLIFSVLILIFIAVKFIFNKN